MKTVNQINKDIINTTLAIQQKFPELAKYIAEMPDTIPNEANPKISAQNLNAYSQSLNSLLAQYSKNHKSNKIL